MTTFNLHDATWAREARRRRLVDRPPPKPWRFALGERARIWSGGPVIGTVRGRSEFDDEPDRYEVSFVRESCVVRRWMAVSELTPVDGDA